MDDHHGVGRRCVNCPIGGKHFSCLVERARDSGLMSLWAGVVRAIERLVSFVELCR